MNIASADLAAVISAAFAGLATLATVVTNLVMTIRQGRRINQHGADIADLKASTGTFKVPSAKADER